MTTRKKIITIETRQRILIRQNLRRAFWCKFCAAEVETLTPEQSAAIFDLDLREIYRNIENGRLHFIEAENRSPQICLNSLKNFKDAGEIKYGTKN